MSRAAAAESTKLTVSRQLDKEQCFCIPFSFFSAPPIALRWQTLQNYFHGLPFYDWWRVLANGEDQARRRHDGILVYDNDKEAGYMLDILAALFESLAVVSFVRMAFSLGVMYLNVA
jgi:hypothetical protein